jgi:hypothetical protein
MPSPGSTSNSNSSRDFDDAEKGLYDSSEQTLACSPPPPVYLDEKKSNNDTLVEALPSPVSPIHEGITPQASVPVLSITGAVVKEAPAAVSSSPATASPSGPSKKKTAKKVSRWLLFRLWFNTYRKFFILTTVLNLIGMILAAVGHFEYAENHLGALVLGNLLFAVLMRNELFLRILYTIFIYSLRSWAPVQLKIAVTSVLQHVGGIHSGCALSGAAWLIYKIVDIIKHRSVQHSSVVATGIVTSVLVIISILSAFPWVRNNYHNAFEKHHRFIGWLGLGVSSLSTYPRTRHRLTNLSRLPGHSSFSATRTTLSTGSGGLMPTLSSALRSCGSPSL